jgi:membrane protease subunit HflC
MSGNRTFGLLFGLGALVGASIYTIDAREVAVVTSFGATVKILTEPGLYFRAPWPIHEVVRYDSRARLLEVEPTEMFTRDKKNLVVEPFVVWRVSEPGRFLESVGTMDAVAVQLSDVVISRVASGLAGQDLSSLFSLETAEDPLLPASVLADVAEVAQQRLGVEILDLRLRGVGLPLQNEQSIYERMRAERLRIANAYRSEGDEEAAGIRARADRQVAEILAAARREAAIITSRAEEVAARRYAEAYAEDPGFYRYLRSLEALEEVLGEGDTLILDSESELFRVLTGERP